MTEPKFKINDSERLETALEQVAIARKLGFISNGCSGPRDIASTALYDIDNAQQGE